MHTSHQLIFLFVYLPMLHAILMLSLEVLLRSTLLTLVTDSLCSRHNVFAEALVVFLFRFRNHQ